VEPRHDQFAVMVSKATRSSTRPRRIRLPPGPVLRMFFLGAAAVAACVWALVRYYTHVLPPMVVPVDAGEREIPVETLEGD
jgi:hypothetical protein